MIALAFIAAFVVYLAVSCVVVWLVVRWARRTGRGVKRWAAAAILAMYLLVFWDHIPTLILYKYYCATKAGFWVYKTPEQWKAENPGVAETLTWRELSPQFNNVDGSWETRLNERFIWKHQGSNGPILPVGLDIESIIDTKTDEIVVKRISVGAGYQGGKGFLRFWTAMGPYVPSSNFYQYKDSFKQLGREVK